MLAALAFLPEEDVFAGFDELSIILPEECNQLFSYFKKTYVGSEYPNRRGAVKAQFPPSIWNMHNRVKEERPRTNNASEGFNHGLHAMAGADHLNLFKMAGVLK